jgi:predicted phage tail protein
MHQERDLSGAQDLREIRLYGHLAKRFGRVHTLAVRTCREAVVALSEMLPGFEQHILKHNMPGYHVFGGHRKVSNCRSAETLDGPLGRGEPVCIMPAVAGSKKAGALQTIIGVTLIVLGALVFKSPALVQAGIALTVGGVVQLLTPVKKADEAAKDDKLASYVFQGPVNSTQQGMPVPVVFGEFICGSAVISQGIHSSDIAS